MRLFDIPKYFIKLTERGIPSQNIWSTINNLYSRSRLKARRRTLMAAVQYNTRKDVEGLSSSTFGITKNQAL